MEDLDKIFESVENEDITDIFTDVEPIQQNEPAIDDIFSDDDIVLTTPSSSVLDKFLQSKGFIDSKITIIDENNEESTVNFNELSEEEQLDILGSFNQDTSAPDLKADEQQWINELRSNNLTMDQFLDLYKQSIIEEAGLKPEVSYDIDAYDDKELYLLDLKNKFDLSDEELQSELEKELQNEEIFSKKVNKLRSEYKQLEDEYKVSQQAEFEAQQQQQYNEFVNQMVNIASNVSEFHGLELDDTDKNDTLSYLLDLDDTGMSQFYKDLNNPQKLYEVAWYLKYGSTAFKIIEDAYEAEIAKLKTKEDKPRVVRQNTHNSNELSIHELN